LPVASRKDSLSANSLPGTCRDKDAEAVSNLERRTIKRACDSPAAHRGVRPGHPPCSGILPHHKMRARARIGFSSTKPMGAMHKSEPFSCMSSERTNPGGNGGGCRGPHGDSLHFDKIGDYDAGRTRVLLYQKSSNTKSLPLALRLSPYTTNLFFRGLKTNKSSGSFLDQMLTCRSKNGGGYKAGPAINSPNSVPGGKSRTPARFTTFDTAIYP